jgi:hypothetical protein
MPCARPPQARVPCAILGRAVGLLGMLATPTGRAKGQAGRNNVALNAAAVRSGRGEWLGGRRWPAPVLGHDPQRAQQRPAAAYRPGRGGSTAIPIAEAGDNAIGPDNRSAALPRLKAASGAATCWCRLALEAEASQQPQQPEPAQPRFGVRTLRHHRLLPCCCQRIACSRCSARHSTVRSR